MLTMINSVLLLQESHEMTGCSWRMAAYTSFPTTMAMFKRRLVTSEYNPEMRARKGHT